MITPLQPTALPTELSSDVGIRFRNTPKDAFSYAKYSFLLIVLYLQRKSLIFYILKMYKCKYLTRNSDFQEEKKKTD